MVVFYPLLYHPRSVFFPFENISNSFASMSITIWIACFSHSIICFLIFEKFFEVLIDYFFICSHKSKSTGVHTFRTLSCVPHHKYWTAIRWYFLLDSP